MKTDIFIKLGIGIKIVDEAHLQYENTFSIDYSVNVKKNFYLTATFEQSDSKTNAVFHKHGVCCEYHTIWFKRVYIIPSVMNACFVFRV